MMKMKRSRVMSFIIIALTYSIALVGCYFLYDEFKAILPEKYDNRLLIFLILDCIATIWVFLVSVLFNNSSVYDPYWSVMPMAMIVMYAVKAGNIGNGFVILLVVIILIWGLRLTGNWAYTFRNLHIQDWRYTSLKEGHPKLWFFINLFGIHFIPTLVVFVAMLPAFKYVEEFVGAAQPTVGTFLGAIVALIAIGIETIADVQLHSFRKISSHAGLVNDKGLWKNSRHPNYFGEILFWFGICMMGISFYQDETWVLIFSPLVVFLLFVSISIPMMEKRQLASKPAYKEYKENTNMLLPFGSKTNKDKKE